MNFKHKSILSLSAILVLSGCSADESYRAHNNEHEEIALVNKALSGRVLAGTFKSDVKVCIDVNQDGLCNETELQSISDEKGYFSFEGSTFSDFNNEHLLALVEEENTYVLSALISSQNINISPFSTLHLNERLYNPYTQESDFNITNYLITNINELNASMFNNYNYEDNIQAEKITGSFFSAYKLGSEKPYESIANAVDEIIKQKSLTVEVTSSTPQKSISNSLRSTDLSQTLSWTSLYKDEKSVGVSYTKDKIISYSKWHNKLTLLDTSDKNAVAVLNDNKTFLYTVGERDDTDASTGASEQVLKQSILSQDENTVYSLLNTYEDSSLDIGVGLYKTDISSGLGDTQFAKISGADFYPINEINAIALNVQGTRLGAASDEKKIYIFDSSDLSTYINIIETRMKVKSLCFSEDGQYILAGLYGLNGDAFVIYTLEGNLIDTLETNSYAEHIYTQGSKIYISSSKHNTVFQLTLSDNNELSISNTFTTNNLVKSIALSADSDTLLLATAKKQVELFDVNNANIHSQISVSENVQAVVPLLNNRFSIVYGLNISNYEILSNKIKYTEEEKLQWKNGHR